jgi:hypothetical protein
MFTFRGKRFVSPRRVWSGVLLLLGVLLSLQYQGVDVCSMLLSRNVAAFTKTPSHHDLTINDVSITATDLLNILREPLVLERRAEETDEMFVARFPIPSKDFGRPEFLQMAQASRQGDGLIFRFLEQDHINVSILRKAK